MSNRNRFIPLLAVLTFCGPAVFAAGDDAIRLLKIGYVEIVDDPRYDEKRACARIRVKPHHRPLAGAELAVRESRVLVRALKTEFELTRIEAAGPQDAVRGIQDLRKTAEVHFFIVDADAGALGAMAAATAGGDILLFNISEPADRLRGEDCRAQLFHVIPSYAMLGDALGQFLVFKNWRRVLMLQGPLAEDREFARAFERSAKRFGVKIDGIRKILPGNDPREREQNNMSLITSGSRADLVFVADIEGEIGRGLPYKTQAPLLVIGSEGLQASGWHWAWERHGAPQLNQRFEGLAGRRMTASDRAAWTAVRSIIESVSRSRPGKPVPAPLYPILRKLRSMRGIPAASA